MPDPNLLPELDYCPLPPNLDRELAAELSALHKQQFDALQTAIFIRMSATEIQEYEQRSARIRAIYRTTGLVTDWERSLS
jgi:hypothetical protein